ncbi:MAG: transposase [Clostridiales bacterium]|nr:transposase [Clostridiales bacterium]
MAIIPKSLFTWEGEIQRLGDLKRLQIVLDTLPDEPLMRKLEQERGKGRDDFPVRAMWNLMIAGYVFGHNSIASLLRELNRNRQLAHLCGFGFRKLPEAHNMSRFIGLLLKHEGEIRAMFEELCQTLYELLEGFGKELAIDSKWVESAANRASGRKGPDGRSETEARKGAKAYSGVREDGSAWEKIVTCFGFKIHLLVDAVYELPVAYAVTDAAASDVAEGKKMVSKLKEERPEVLKGCRHWMGDRGYDDSALIEMLKENGVRAVIDKRAMWKTETEKEVPGYKDAYYDEAGNVYCYTKNRGRRRLMTQNGYESGRDAVRFKCPAEAYGRECTEMGECKCKNIRIPLSTDKRIFTQVQRGSYKWKRLYRQRTAVERVNSRLDGAYGFEERRTRGLARTKLHVGMALLVMLATAVWKAKNDQGGMARSLMKVA